MVSVLYFAILSQTIDTWLDIAPTQHFSGRQTLKNTAKSSAVSLAISVLPKLALGRKSLREGGFLFMAQN